MVRFHIEGVDKARKPRRKAITGAMPGIVMLRRTLPGDNTPDI
jgi:hypothetical protein